MEDLIIDSNKISTFAPDWWNPESPYYPNKVFYMGLKDFMTEEQYSPNYFAYERPNNIPNTDGAIYYIARLNRQIVGRTTYNLEAIENLHNEVIPHISNNLVYNFEGNEYGYLDLVMSTIFTRMKLLNLSKLINKDLENILAIGSRYSTNPLPDKKIIHIN